MDALEAVNRHNVHVSGLPAGQPIVFAHGFGCDQQMWRLVAPQFEDRLKVVRFDHVGAGGSDYSAYDLERHASLEGYADDVVQLCRALGLTDVIFVGHSVSAMMGALAAKADPELFAALILIGPSPCYINDGNYHGGFERSDIDDLLASLDSNYLGWSSAMAPVIMGQENGPELTEELTASFCRTDPDIARRFAGVTFLSDNRDDLGDVQTRTLVLQCSDDVIAPEPVGAYVAATLPHAVLVQLEATGHCPHLSAPVETASAIATFVQTLPIPVHAPG